jgi:hypothetical protein
MLVGPCCIDSHKNAFRIKKSDSDEYNSDND